jgi:hypothetical protein
VRRGLVILLGFLAFAAPAQAGGPFMAVGAAEDIAKQQDYAFAKANMDKAKLAGLDTIRLTQTWTKGQRAVGGIDSISLGNAVKAAQFTGVRVVLSLYPFGSSVTPTTDEDRADFAAFAVDAAKKYPWVHDFVIGNEPNLNRFWLPQFGPNGEDVAAQGYEALLATTYDALKAVRPRSTVYGGALAPRGVDKPGTGRDTHSPTAFVADLGAFYRASGRAVPIMDAFAFHPYGEDASVAPGVVHPNGTTIAVADYAKLVALLGAAFDGTAQRGSALPILYDEYGVQAQIPAAKAPFYTGVEQPTVKAVDEATQSRYYADALALTFCQPTVIGLLLFHVQDEPALDRFQSGIFYADGSPKTSLYPVRDAASRLHRGIVTQCPGLALTPKLVLTAGKPGKRATKVFLTCSLDCAYSVQLDGRTLTGVAVGRITKTLLFRGALARGRHAVSGSARATVNVGPPTVASARVIAR